jgi:hypothetical protein
MDIVYVLGTGSRWKNNELRYSLRSVEKNLVNVDKIWVVGANPGFTKGIRFIEHPDEFEPVNASGNVTRKLIRVCSEPELSEDFLFFNDDFIVIKPCDANKLPTWYKQDMADYPPEFFNKNDWRRRMKATFNTLQSCGLPTLNYDYHAPMHFNKTLFPQVMQRFDYSSGIGLLYRSLYGNTLQVPATQMTIEKRTIFRELTFAEINYLIRKSHFFAFSDAGLNDELKLWLFANFPTQSRYE